MFKRFLLIAGIILPSSIALTNLNSPVVEQKYVEHIREHNPKLPSKSVQQILVSNLKWASKHNIDPKLLLAIQQVESRYKMYAISSSGAYGVMQVIPVWHKDKIIKAREELGNPELFNIDTNIYLGTWVLKDCLKKTKSTRKALLCYSGGTKGYDKKVLLAYHSIKRL